MLISTIDKFRFQKKIYFKFMLPDAKWRTALKVVGEVVRTIPPDAEERPPALGVHFLTIMAEHKDILADFIRLIITDESLAEKIDRQEKS